MNLRIYNFLKQPFGFYLRFAVLSFWVLFLPNSLKADNGVIPFSSFKNSNKVVVSNCISSSVVGENLTNSNHQTIITEILLSLSYNGNEVFFGIEKFFVETISLLRFNQFFGVSFVKQSFDEKTNQTKNEQGGGDENCQNVGVEIFDNFDKIHGDVRYILIFTCIVASLMFYKCIIEPVLKAIFPYSNTNFSGVGDNKIKSEEKKKP